MDVKEIIWEHRNIESYSETWDYQEEIMRKNLAKKSERFKNPDSEYAKESIEQRLITVSHPHVYTLGKSGAIAHLLLSEEKLKQINATFYHTNRGGDITYHGPGQLVAYPLLDLETFKTDLGWYMRMLEETIIKLIARYGLKGQRLEGSTGVWLDIEDKSKVRKICAMGVKCSRWLTMHGLALNVNTDLSYFGHIVPCGIVDKGVTSIEKELGRKIDEKEVLQCFIEDFGAVFGVSII